MRNRLISGLADAVLVVEAAHASGSLITARWAADQGRDVYVIPGRVDHPMARGCLRLIREGATPVESPEQLLEDLWGFQFTPKGATLTPAAPGGGAGDLLRALEGETLCVDELAQRLDRRVDATLSLLVQLELEDWVRRGPGGLYGLHRPLPPRKA
jgi:DNA processing protein